MFETVTTTHLSWLITPAAGTSYINSQSELHVQFSLLVTSNGAFPDENLPRSQVNRGVFLYCIS